MRENHLKKKIQARQTAFGIFVAYPCPALVELAGILGFDWVFIDSEHGPSDVETVEHMIRAAETTGITPIVRLPYSDPRLINRYLDCGAMGILIPHLRSAEMAREVVACAKYHPLGNRGAGSITRAADYGYRFTATEYTQWANASTMVFGILEDRESVDALPEILKVEGIDGLIFGTSDFSQSVGLPGQTRHPEVVKVQQEVLRTVLASDKLMVQRVHGEGEAAKKEAQRLIEMGIPMLTTSITDLIAGSARWLLQLKS